MDYPNKSEVKLTHYGRKSGKPFDVTIWYVVIDGALWVGSQSDQRSWVRNLQATPRCAVDFGAGPVEHTAEWTSDPAAVERFTDAVRAKHPIMSRVILLMNRGAQPVAARLVPAA